MPDIDLMINGRPYPLTCEPGQEEHLMILASILDEKASAIAARVGGGVGDQRILLMAALEVADEAHEVRLAAEKAPKSDSDAIEQAQDYVVEIFDHLAGRLNTVADHMENALKDHSAPT